MRKSDDFEVDLMGVINDIYIQETHVHDIILTSFDPNLAAAFMMLQQPNLPF
jgi:hypothetical protein